MILNMSIRYKRMKKSKSRTWKDGYESSGQKTTLSGIRQSISEEGMKDEKRKITPVPTNA